MRSTAGATTRVEGELEKEHLGVTPETGAKREGVRKVKGKPEKKNPQEQPLELKENLRRKTRTFILSSNQPCIGHISLKSPLCSFIKLCDIVERV